MERIKDVDESIGKSRGIGRRGQRWMSLSELKSEKEAGRWKRVKSNCTGRMVGKEK